MVKIKGTRKENKKEIEDLKKQIEELSQQIELIQSK
jgi:hypothetical protein